VSAKVIITCLTADFFKPVRHLSLNSRSLNQSEKKASGNWKSITGVDLLWLKLWAFDSLLKLSQRMSFETHLMALKQAVFSMIE